MPGHDYSLRALFEPESLNSETMLLTWICPVRQGETSPVEVLRRLFTKYQELLWKQGKRTRVPQSRLFSAPICGCRVAPHGLIPEAASLVSIIPTHLPVPHCLLTVGFTELPFMPYFLTIAVSGYLQCLTTSATLLLPSGSGSTPNGIICASFKKFSKACSTGSPTE